MRGPAIKVPASLLLDRGLSPSAKLVAIFLQLNQSNRPAHAPLTPTTVVPGLRDSSGLSRDTIRRALAELEAANQTGAAKAAGTTPTGWAIMPVDLLVDNRLGIRAKLMYGILQAAPGFRRSKGQITFAELTSLAAVTVNTVKQAVRTLHQTGWVQVLQRNKYCPVNFTLGNPCADGLDTALHEVKLRLIESSFKGEAIMREYLSLIVESDQYDDNASPAFLVNPLTGQEMQFDRYYPPDVAVEFNGPQHYRPTPRYPNEGKARQQRARDYMKMGICVARGIRLLVLHFEDLNSETIRQKVTGLLPLRNVDGYGQLIAYLDAVGRAYRQDARQRQYNQATPR